MTSKNNGSVGTVAVTGSLAYDLIMDFPGNFKDHILPDKLHVINMSFLVGDLKKQRGGCAANIAYTMSLLHTPTRIVAAAGRDFDEYAEWLGTRRMDTGGITIFDDEITASCYITSDRVGNQITGFHPGAMKRAREISLRESLNGGARYCIVAPDDPDGMLRHCQEARELGIPFVFDPSFQVIALEGEKLMAGAHGAYALILNDYEFALFQEKTGRSLEDLLEHDIEMIIVTFGDKGSEIYRRGEAPVKIPSALAGEVVDPTGAGDAFRGGFLSGLVRGFDLDTCGRMGSVAAAYAIENHGTMNHDYTLEEFWGRYASNFGELPLSTTAWTSVA